MTCLAVAKGGLRPAFFGGAIVNRCLPAITLACLGSAIWSASFATSLPEQVLTCAAETDSARRLGCYDQLAVDLKKLGTASASASTGTRREAEAEFGLQEGPLARKRQHLQPKQITALVSRVQHRSDGELVVSLDNGQVWRQIESLAFFPLEVGDKVQIDAGAFDSYILSAPSKRATRVTRIQ